MKCKSCEESIPSKFVHSIKINTCPYCGGEIMEAALQKVLTNLQALMKEAEPFMTEVEEWFASNYSLRKGAASKAKEEQLNHTSSGSGSIFDDDNIDDETLRKQTEFAKSSINFQQRAGIKGNDVKSLIEKIQSGKGAADPSEFVGIDPDYGAIDLSSEIATPLTQTDAITMMQAINQESVSDDPVKNYYEIEKLKKLQRTQPSGQGKFSRGQ